MTRYRKGDYAEGEQRFSWGSPDHPHPYIETYDPESGKWTAEI